LSADPAGSRPAFSPGPRGLSVASFGSPTDPTVVLVHGSMDRGSSLRATARRLAGEAHVVLYDRRGYGRSRELGGPFDVTTNVDDLVAVLEGRPAVVFGHSLGGDIALAAAQRHPELIRAVGAYEPPMPWEPWWPEATAGSEAIDCAETAGTEEAAERFMRRMVGDELWNRLPATTRAERRAEGAALVGELVDMRGTAPYDPAAIEVPVLLACGEHGAAHHRRAATILRERLAIDAADGRVVFEEVPSTRHGIHLDDPQALAGLVRRLVAMAGPELRAP
jgi:pimeloyl-ACP methyl ester carboxylesterase